LLINKKFPSITIIKYKESTAKIKNILKNNPNLFKLRLLKDKRYHMINLLDIPLMANKSKILYLDSDVLFYKYPSEIMRWLKRKDTTSILYMKDIQESQIIDANDTLRYFNSEYIKKFNMGILGYSKHTVNLSHLNKYITYLIKHKKIHCFWRDQTYWMIHATSFYKELKQLNNNYVVSFTGKIMPQTVCYHFISPIRELIYTESIVFMVSHWS